MSSLVGGLIAGYGIALPVGAVAVLIVNAAIRSGFPAGFAAGAGAATADTLFAALAALAGFIIAQALQPYSDALRVVGGLVLMTIAGAGLWKGLMAQPGAPGTGEAHHLLTTYLQFVAITGVNPLTMVYFTALILGRNPASSNDLLSANLLFVVGAGVASLSWQTFLAAVGSLAARHLTPRFRLAATVVGNLIVLGLGARLVIPAII
ncbi:MAG: LysE family transporter [Chloroflexi bacterium]|nr:LysE family transporter [Chloroflexota bacterium]